MQVTLPDQIRDVTCTDCGADTIVNDNYTVEINADNGKAHAWMLCSADCGWLGTVFSWRVDRTEYESLFGHVPNNVLLAGDERLLPPAHEARVLPPGPWGVFQVQPSPIPDEAWEIRCPNQGCAAFLTPDPLRVFYHDEFISTATLGLRCDVCQKTVLENLSWPLTPEQHFAVFGRTVGDYRPEHDPEDPDDYEVQYSVWRTADRGALTHFRSLEHLAGADDYDLFAIGPGEYTITHWPTGAVWDAPEFAAEHQTIISAAYVADDEDSYDDE